MNYLVGTDLASTSYCLAGMALDSLNQNNHCSAFVYVAGSVLSGTLLIKGVLKDIRKKKEFRKLERIVSDESIGNF